MMKRMKRQKDDARRGSRQYGVKQGVILAAGKGSRAFPLTFNLPKPLFPVCNKPVMQYQIEAMNEAGIDEIVVVIGHLGEQIKNTFGDGSQLGVKLCFVVDDDPQGIASSLMCAKGLVKGPFALFLGDIFLPRMDLISVINSFSKHKAEGIIIARKEDDEELIKRNFAVVTGQNGQVKRVVEKPKVPPSSIKGYGLYLFSLAIFNAIQKTSPSPLRNEYEIQDAIQKLIDGGGKVYCESWDIWDFNLSYPEDLLMCNLMMLREKGLDYLIGQKAQIGRGVQIKASVIGDRAVVDSPMMLKECLVFADTKVKSTSSSARRLIFADRLVLST